jgi:hypothetical protein
VREVPCGRLGPSNAEFGPFMKLGQPANWPLVSLWRATPNLVRRDLRTNSRARGTEREEEAEQKL